MGCDIPTVKYSLFLFNTLSATFGVCSIVVNWLALENYGDEERAICIFMIVLGFIAFLISFFACCGAIQENICLIWTYAICLLVIIIANSVIIFGYLSHIDGETRAHKDINTAWDMQQKGTDAMSKIQIPLGCCGKNNSFDYIDANMTISISCFIDQDTNNFTVLYPNGCLKKLVALYEAAEHWITIFTWSSFSVEVFAFASACILAIKLTNQQRRAEC